MLVRINIRDALLKKALEVMLSDIGYVLTEDNDACLCVITDCIDYVSDKCKVLYVLREEIRGKDVLIRPFGLPELESAMKTLLNGMDKGKAAGVYIDRKCLTVAFDDVKIQLTEKEFLLFVLLYENKGKTVSDSEIVSSVWSDETNEGSNIAAVYVNYLRKKLDERLGKKIIYRVRGEGYTLKINEKDL